MFSRSATLSLRGNSCVAMSTISKVRSALVPTRSFHSAYAPASCSGGCRRRSLPKPNGAVPFVDPALAAPDAPIWWTAHAGGDALDARSYRCQQAHKADLVLSRARSVSHVVIGPDGVENVLVRTTCNALTLRLVGARAHRHPVNLTYLVAAKSAKSDARLLRVAHDLLLNPERVTVRTRRRLMLRNALIALDGKSAGATYFEIAVVIFGPVRARQAWRSTSRSLKDQIRRAWRLGKRLRNGAYRELLR